MASSSSANPIWTDPNGTSHPFNAVLYQQDTTACPNGAFTQSLTPGTATDGSGYSIKDDGNGSPLVIDNNGMQVYPQIIDRYGNYLTTDANGNLIDDTGRVPVIVTQSGNITYYDVLAPNGPIDSFGNMSQSGTVSSSLTFGTNNRIISNGYGYDSVGNLTSFNNGAFTATYAYDANDRLVNVNSGSATYSYDPLGQRVRKDVGGSGTEYVYFGGRPLAERNSDGTWSDYIYANGQRIARADSFDARIHTHGTFDTTGEAAVWTVTSNRYVVKSGDRICWRQFSTSIGGGLGINFSSGSSSAWSSYDQDGNLTNSDNDTGNWHNRCVDLTPYAGLSTATVWVGANDLTPAGTWDMYFGDISITSSDGSVTPIYWRNSTAGLGSPWTNHAGPTNLQGVTEASNQSGDSVQGLTTTTYYHPDQLGSSRMLTSAEGWPVLSDTFYPFGQEQAATADPNHYKFTGLERDQESGLDNAMFRQYSSTAGRWMSPDPSGLSFADPSDPQSMNLYSYVGNRSLSMVDPTGLGFCITYGTNYYENNDGKAGDFVYSTINDVVCYVGDGGSGYVGGGSFGGGGQSTPAPNNCPAGPANVSSFIQANQAAANSLAQKSGVNADFLLGLSGWESQWGANRFAQQGNNFFSLHGGSSAPFANGSIKAGGANVYLSTFPSYFASGQSFLAQYGNGLAGATTPAAFAQQLINNHFNSGNAATGGNSNFLSNTVTGINMVIRRKGC